LRWRCGGLLLRRRLLPEDWNTCGTASFLGAPLGSLAARLGPPPAASASPSRSTPLIISSAMESPEADTSTDAQLRELLTASVEAKGASLLGGFMN